MLYELTFVVEGADPDDDEVVSTLSEHLDATLARGTGVGLLTLLAEGDVALDAARNAMTSAEHLVPQIRFLYLDRDLVGISEIAERTGRSRQNVYQWVRSERHATVPAPFPKVEGVVGRARIWLWSEVNAWLRAVGLGDDIPGPMRSEITDIDFLISHWSSFKYNYPATYIAWPPSSMAMNLEARHNVFFEIGMAVASYTSHSESVVGSAAGLRIGSVHLDPGEQSRTRVVIQNIPGAQS